MGQNKKTYYAWLFTAAVYAAYIFIFSYLRPYSSDDYYIHGFALPEVVKRSFEVFLNHSPKIGVFIGAAVIYAGKWLFLIVNPLLQLAVVLSAFYFVYLRLPDFKSFKDIYPVMLLMLLSVFAVAAPAHTIFWVNGAVNYSWVFLSFILMLCFLRAWYAGKGILKDTGLNILWLFLLGLCLGMSNENNGPMAFIIFISFFVWCKFKKRSMPKWFYGAFCGVTAGVCILLFSPALSIRVGEHAAAYSSNAFMFDISRQLSEMQKVFDYNFMVPDIVLLILLVLLIKEKGEIFKKEDVILSALCLVICFILAFVFIFAPEDGVGYRIYYSATFFSIISFIFILKYLFERYKLNLVKYFALFMVIAAALILPITTSYALALYKQDLHRAYLIKTYTALGADEVPLPFLLPVNGPTENLDISYFDVISFPPHRRVLYLPFKVKPVTVIEAHKYLLLEEI